MTETKQAWPALAEASYEVAVEMVEEVAVVVIQKIAECDTSFLADLQALNFAIEQWNASRDPDDAGKLSTYQVGLQPTPDGGETQ